MTTINAFINDIKKVDTLSLTIFRKSLLHLKEWELFKNEYEWTNLFFLADLINSELEARLKE